MRSGFYPLEAHKWVTMSTIVIPWSCVVWQDRGLPLQAGGGCAVAVVPGSYRASSRLLSLGAAAEAARPAWPWPLQGRCGCARGLCGVGAESPGAGGAQPLTPGAPLLSLSPAVLPQDGGAAAAPGLHPAAEGPLRRDRPVAPGQPPAGGGGPAGSLSRAAGAALSVSVCGVCAAGLSPLPQ